jgi:hypothetical protein
MATLNVNRRFLMNKQVHILSSHKIVKPIDSRSFLNIDIPSAVMFERDCVLAFKDEHVLEYLKKHMNHPYTISSVRIADVKYYLEKCKNDLVIVNHLICDAARKSTTYTTLRVNMDDISDDDEESHLPVFMNKLAFELELR